MWMWVLTRELRGLSSQSSEAMFLQALLQIPERYRFFVQSVNVIGE